MANGSGPMAALELEDLLKALRGGAEIHAGYAARASSGGKDSFPVLVSFAVVTSSAMTEAADRLERFRDRIGALLDPRRPLPHRIERIRVERVPDGPAVGEWHYDLLCSCRAFLGGPGGYGEALETHTEHAEERRG